VNPKGSNVCRKSKFPQTYDSEGVEHRSKRFFFYKYAIPKELYLTKLLLQATKWGAKLHVYKEVISEKKCNFAAENKNVCFFLNLI